MKKLAAATIAATTLLATAAPSSQAAALNQSFDVSVTLDAACRVQGGPIANPVLNFGTYTAFVSASTPAPTATFALECTRDLAAPTFTFTDGTSYGVIAGLNYNVTPTSAVTTAGNPASAALNGIGTADVRTITLTGDMPAGQAGACAGANATACNTLATVTRTLTITY
jgi:hypothetical protein